MTIYLVKGYLDVAATSLADAEALITALADQTDSDNLLTIARVTDKLETLVQADTGEPLVISSIDDASGTISSWVTDAATTLALGIGDPDANNACLYTSTISLAISGNTRIGTLALNTTALQAAVSGSFGAPPRGSFRGSYANFRTALPFTLQVQKTTAGVTETLALLQIQIRPGVLNGSPVDTAGFVYVSYADSRLNNVINGRTLTSLTGGGATTLDGQSAGTTSFPVGCIVMTSDSNIGRSWKLIGTYIAATNLALGQVKPTNSDATTNPCYWQLI